MNVKAVDKEALAEIYRLAGENMAKDAEIKRLSDENFALRMELAKVTGRKEALESENASLWRLQGDLV